MLFSRSISCKIICWNLTIYQFLIGKSIVDKFINMILYSSFTISFFAKILT